MAEQKEKIKVIKKTLARLNKKYELGILTEEEQKLRDDIMTYFELNNK